MAQFNFSSRLVWRNLILLLVFNCYVSTTENKIRRFWILGVLTLNKITVYLLHAFSYADRMLLTHFRPKMFGVISILYLESRFYRKKLKIRNTTISSEGTWSAFRYDWLENLCNKLHQTVARAESQRIVVHENHRDAKLINTSPYMLTVFPSNTFCWS